MSSELNKCFFTENKTHPPEADNIMYKNFCIGAFSAQSASAFFCIGAFSAQSASAYFALGLFLLKVPVHIFALGLFLLKVPVQILNSIKNSNY